MNRNVGAFMLPICHDADKGSQRACMKFLSLHGDLLLGPAAASADGSIPFPPLVGRHVRFGHAWAGISFAWLGERECLDLLDC